MNGAVIGRVRAVLTGRVRPYSRPGSLSAIDKFPVDGVVAVGTLGVAGDEQGDLRVHGGPDKAVHCYPWAHYSHWRAALPVASAPLLEQPGAFGENLSLDGLDEHGSCIGDRWQIGSAQFEVSQGRQPCWKLNDRFGVPDMALRVQDGGRAGWYLRLSQPGELQAGDAVLLLARPHPHWTMARLLQLIADRDCDPRVLNAVLELPLPSSWQRLFSRRRERGQSEHWAARLIGGAVPKTIAATVANQRMSDAGS